MAKIRVYEGDRLDVVFDAGKCIHAAECVDGLPEVFDRHGRPWVSPDSAGPEEVLDVVRRCPTGALTARRKDGEPEIVTDPDPSIRIVANGPLYLRGPALIMDRNGVVSQETRAALCRCGASKNKPFCDNSHRDIGFTPDSAGP